MTMPAEGSYSSSVLIVSLLIMLVCLPGISRGDSQDSLDNIEVLSNAYKPIELKGFDRDGDEVHITLIHKAIEGKNVRPVDMLIMGQKDYNRFSFYRQSEADPSTYARYYEENISQRFEDNYVCIWNEKTYLVLDNPYQPGDEADVTNSTAVVRLDYSVTDADKVSGSAWLFYIIIVLGALLISGVIIAGVLFWKRRSSNRRSFFIKGNFLYYALQGPDGNVFYYGPEQYNRMYQAGTLSGFQFLGYTREIGGEIYNQNGIMVNPSAYQAGDIMPTPIPSEISSQVMGDMQAPMPHVATDEARSIQILEGSYSQDSSPANVTTDAPDGQGTMPGTVDPSTV